MMTRSRTAPGLKWVANELASVMGELERIDEELARLAARRTHLEKVRSALVEVGALSHVPGLEGLVSPVRAQEQYGGRGVLRNWLRRLLKEAAPAAVDTPTMVRLAEETFDLHFASYRERDRFRKNALTRALRAMLDFGEVERVHDTKAAAGSMGVWRWKSGPSADALRRAARQAEAR
jgi:hypothetical protein